MIEFSCRACGAPIRVETPDPGTRVVCPACGEANHAPELAVYPDEVEAVPVDLEGPGDSHGGPRVRGYTVSYSGRPVGCQAGCVVLIALLMLACGGCLSFLGGLF